MALIYLNTEIENDYFITVFQYKCIYVFQQSKCMDFKNSITWKFL